MDYLLIKKLTCVFVIVVTIISFLRRDQEVEKYDPLLRLMAGFLVVFLHVLLMKFGFFLIEEYIN